MKRATPAKRRGASQSERQASTLLLTHVRQLVTLRGEAGARRGAAMNELTIVEDGAVLCAGGKIVCVGTTDEAARDGWLKRHMRDVVEIDCSGKVVLPGFVDSHTHPVFAAARLVDFEKRISGATYEQIAKAGGGIRASIRGVRDTSVDELSKAALAYFHEMAEQGTTTVEAKSGYGLNVEAELKSLEAIAAAAQAFPGTVVATLLGAHVVPPEFRERRAEYVKAVCAEMIPAAANRKLAQFVDVFWERGAFSEDEASEVFAAAQRHGLGVRAHVCQLTPASLQNLCRFQPASLDHMDYVLDEELPFLAGQDIVATLLPGADYFLGLTHYPPARKLIEAGVAVALATDFNPGTSPTVSLPMVLSLACTQMKMSPAEAITAATINGAQALRMADRKGSLEPGKDADLAIFDVGDYREIAYWFGGQKCVATIANGEVVA